MEHCDTPDEMYLTTESLLSHMLEKHSMIRWACDYCAFKTNTSKDTTKHDREYFDSAEIWMKHMGMKHGKIATAAERITLAGLNERRVIPQLSCPLCPFVVESIDTKIHDHILLHLHEFSLLALPDDAWGAGETSTGTASHASDELSHTQEMRADISMPLAHPEATVGALLQSIRTSNLLDVAGNRVGATLRAIPDWTTAAAKELWIRDVSKYRDSLDAIQSISQEYHDCQQHGVPCLHVTQENFDIPQLEEINHGFWLDKLGYPDNYNGK
jgi:hypothetical protein